MIESINKSLDTLCDKLAGSNYVCAVTIYNTEWLKGERESFVIRTCFDWDVEISNLKNSDISTILHEMEMGFRYTSDDGGHYANKKYYYSKEHKVAMSKVIGETKLLLRDSSKVFSFDFDTGHPFYPVFWSFSFLVKVKDKAYVIVGSSSD